jgi:hypothetical protein
MYPTAPDVHRFPQPPAGARVKLRLDVPFAEWCTLDNNDRKDRP